MAFSIWIFFTKDGFNVFSWYSGFHSNRCRGIRPYLEWMGKSVPLGLWHDPRGFLLSFNVRLAPSWVATGMLGLLSWQSRRIYPNLEKRRVKRAQNEVCPGTRYSSQVGVRMSEKFLICIKVSSIHSNFKRILLISLEMLQWEGASSHFEGESRGFPRGFAGSMGFLTGCDVDPRVLLILPQWSQVSFRIVTGTSGFLAIHCMGSRPQIELCPETPCSSPVGTGISGLRSRFAWGVRRRLELKEGTLLSSRVATGISWSPWVA